MHLQKLSQSQYVLSVKHKSSLQSQYSEGQDDVCVVSEDRTKNDGAQRDLRLYVRDKECPSEMKVANGSKNELPDPS